MIYYAVFNSESKEPDGVFKSRRWAENFVGNQKGIWVEAKYSIWEVSVARMGRRKLKIVRKVIWLDYVSHGIKLLLNNIKQYAKDQHAGIFRQGK